MKKKDLFMLLQGLNDVADFSGAKFAYAIAKNIKLVEDECNLLRGLTKPNDAFMEYNGKREALAQKYCEKNEDNTPKTNDNEYVMGVGKLKFKQEHSALLIEYADAIAEYNSKLADFNALLEENADIELFKISSELLPDAITPKHVVAIMAVIEE
ncbi:MAG: hypothetical protein A2X58_08625 [Nitrospirae bacterium GWC2_56_14]|nr:MAG: hypothetical protein A2X58_08625 [Nitrospirae bacterium GWC2_56_14]